MGHDRKDVPFEEALKNGIPLGEPNKMRGGIRRNLVGLHTKYCLYAFGWSSVAPFSGPVQTREVHWMRSVRARSRSPVVLDGRQQRSSFHTFDATSSSLPGHITRLSEPASLWRRCSY